MKKLVISLASLTVLGNVFGSIATAAQVDNVNYRGSSAYASFYNFIPTGDGCGIYQDTWLWVANNVVHDSPGASTKTNEGYVSIWYWDSCNDSWGDGWSWIDGSNNLSFKGQKLNSATLSGSIDVYSWQTGETIPVTFNLTLVGTGDTYRGQNTGHYRYSNTMYRYRSNGSWRGATLTGNLTMNGMNLLDNYEWGWAELSISNSGSLSVYHF